MKLPTDNQIERVLAILRKEGITLASLLAAGGRIDILETGLSISTIPDAPASGIALGGSAYDNWKVQDNDRAAPDQKAA